MDYDIIIVGAGPAGAILASLIKADYRVLLVDRRNLDQATDCQKSVCCGGLLAPDAQKALAHLAMSIPKEVLVSPQMFSVKTLDFDNRLERYYQRHYINVDREAFDRFLVSKVADHVSKWFSTTYRSHQKTADGYRVHFERNGQSIAVQAPLLVAADGAISRLRERVFKGAAQPDKYISIQKWYRSKRVSPHFYSIFDRQITDFYSWIIEKDGQIVLGTALPSGKAADQKFQLLEDKIRQLDIIQGEVIRREGTWIMRTRKLNQIHLFKDNIAFVGEAAGLISPSSAEGISYAIRSGQYLAEAINADFDHFAEIYARKCRPLKRNILFKNVKLQAMYQPLLRKWIIKSGLLSMPLRRAQD